MSPESCLSLPAHDTKIRVQGQEHEVTNIVFGNASSSLAVCLRSSHCSLKKVLLWKCTKDKDVPSRPRAIHVSSSTTRSFLASTNLCDISQLYQNAFRVGKLVRPAPHPTRPHPSCTKRSRRSSSQTQLPLCLQRTG